MQKLCGNWLTALLIMGLVVAGTGCGSSSKPANGASGSNEMVLRQGNGAEPQDLDPQTVTGLPEQRIMSSLFEGLACADPDDLHPIPGVAESWDVSPDGLVYTFHLRANAKWSNGDPVTAGDFVYSWQRILSPALGSEYASMLYCLKNGKPFNLGTLTDFSQVGVRAVDEHTLEATLERPTPFFLSMQIHHSWQPVHPATIEKFGKMDQRGTPWTQPGNMVSNGPFQLETWDPNEVIRVTRNAHYWDAQNVKLDAVEYYPIDNLQTEERNFRSGMLHVTESILVNKIEAYKKDNPAALKIDPYLSTYYYRFNVTKPPFDNPKVRRAFAMSIDREQIVKHILRGGQTPAACLTPPNVAGYTCTAGIPYDPDAARALLAEAGYPDGKGLPPIELIYNTSENHKLIAEAVQQMWKKHLNVEISLLNLDWKVYLDSMLRLDYQVARSGWVGDYVDPNAFLECMTSNSGNNRTGYKSEAYDALLEKALNTLDGTARNAAYMEAEKQLVEDCPIAPIYFYTRVYLRSPELQGWHSNLLGYMFYKYFWIGKGDAATSTP